MKKTSTIILLFIISASCTPPGIYRGKWMFRGSKRNSLIKTAKRYLGVKYKRGGTAPSGFDCSGYVMYVYRKNGISVPRTAKLQYRSGRRVSLGRAKPGDLVFFKTSGRRISHVGLYLGGFKFIHSPRTGKSVSYASINKSYWKKRYAGAVTFIDSGRSGNRKKFRNAVH